MSLVTLLTFGRRQELFYKYYVNYVKLTEIDYSQLKLTEMADPKSSILSLQTAPPADLTPPLESMLRGAYRNAFAATGLIMQKLF